MWEALGNSRRQDRVLHGAAKLFHVALAFVLYPLWLTGQRLTGPLRRLLARLDPPVPLPVPPARERSMDALLGELQKVPHRLHRSRTATLRKGIPDLAMFLLSQKRQTANFGYAYPNQFEYHYFDGADGERIAAAVAVHEGTPRPGLVVVHGLFSSRLFDYVREIAVRAYFDWGFNVAAVDLRSFGMTEMLTRAPNTGGWKEGEDVVCAGRYLKERGSTTVGALGISLGSSSVLNAGHVEGAERFLDGGILAIAGPADTEMATDRISRKVGPTHPFFLISKTFEAFLVSKVRNLGWPKEVADLRRLMELVVAPHYGLGVDEVHRRSSAKNHIQGTRVPLLVLHAEDDEVIPVEHARMLEEAAAGNPNVRVWILPGGAHAAFDALDKRWTYTVYRAFFERWAEYAAVGDEAEYPRAESGRLRALG